MPRFWLTALTFMLAGCGAIPPSAQFTPFQTETFTPVETVPFLFGAEIVSLVNTQKTLSDHVFTMVSGQDCSSLRAKSEGQGRYCIDKNAQPPEKPQVYCFKSLGSVTCYANENPYGDNVRPLEMRAR